MSRQRGRNVVQATDRPVPGLYPSLMEPMGFHQALGAFTLANDVNTPVYMPRDVEFDMFKHVDYLAGTTKFESALYTANSGYDLIAKTLIEEWGPLFRSYLNRQKPYATLPNMMDFACVLFQTESLYQLACMVMSKYYLCNKFDWSKVPPCKSQRPRVVDIEASLWYVDPVVFEYTWAPMLSRIARLPCLPRVREMIRLLHQPFVIGERDTIIRHFTYKQWDATSPAAVIAMRDAALVVLGALEGDSSVSEARQWLEQYLPHRLGIPEMGFAGVSPLHSTIWWNGSTDIFQVVDPHTLATNQILKANIPKATDVMQYTMSTFGGSTTHVPSPMRYNTLPQVQAGAYAGQLSFNELMLMPILAFVNYDAGATKTMTVKRTFVRMGAPIVIDDVSEDMYELAGFPTNNVADGGWEPELTQYSGIAETRHGYALDETNAATPALDEAWSGIRDEDFYPVQVPEIAFTNLVPLAVMQMAGFDELTELDAITAGARPSEARQNIAEIYKRHG